MSNESKGKRIAEWATAFGVPVAMIGIWASVVTTNKSIGAQEDFLDRSIKVQEQILERQNRVALAGTAYAGFLKDLVPDNTRVPVALFGGKKVFQKFLDLEKVVDEYGREVSNPEVRKALLSFLDAVRVDVLGEGHALTETELEAVLGISQ